MMVSFFFFQAEDGIRDYKVTGVQTCALPIWSHIADYVEIYLRVPAAERERRDPKGLYAAATRGAVSQFVGHDLAAEEPAAPRSEERRVGKEWRARWSQQESKEKSREHSIART